MVTDFKKIPKHVLKYYDNSARNFKKIKRAQVRELENQLNKLRLGCAFMPDGCVDLVDQIDHSISKLVKLASIKSWGR